nr:DUF930 domain-containing protein [Labrys monachus]
MGALALVCLASPGEALDGDTRRQLMELAPQARLEQAYDTEAMRHINKDKNPYTADKVIAYTFEDPVLHHDAIIAPGAVFRSKGDWYHLSYQCSTGPRHVEVQSLNYKIGDKIPRAAWEKYNLYN